METLSQVYCSLTTFFVIQKQTFASTCGITNKSEILPEREGSFTNITYLLNATERSAFSGSTSILYEVCVNNTLTVQCEFEWKEGSSHPFVEKWGPGDDVVCSYEHRDLDNFMVTWEIKISQLVSRSLSVMQVYLENKTHKTKKIIRQIHIDILYPPKVTSLTVDGQEVNDTHLISESQKVNISCSFDKGNPPVTFSLVDNNGKELVRGSGPLTYSLLVDCEDDWPTVRCEGNGSEQNRSVSFLVKCPPKFTESFVKIVSSPSLNITLPVKSYTTEFNNCSLTSVTLEGNGTITPNCTLTGHPPNLTLSFHLNNEENRIQGMWMLIFFNNKGPANTTLDFTKESRMRFKNESENPAQARGTEIGIGVACGAVLLVVVVIAGIGAVINVKKSKNASALPVRPSDGSSDPRENLRGSFGTMIVNDVYGTSNGSDNNNQVLNLPNDDSPLLLTSSGGPPRPPRSQLARTRAPTGDVQSTTPGDDGAEGHTYVSSSDVRKKKKMKKTGISSSPGSEANSYVSPHELRERKQQKTQGKTNGRPGGTLGTPGETYVSPNAVRMLKKRAKEEEFKTPIADGVSEPNSSMLIEKPSCSRNADGLIYGDLVFTTTNSSKSIIGTETMTEYADIKVTAIVPPPRDYKQKIGRLSNK